MASDYIKATVRAKKQGKTTVVIAIYALLSLFSLLMGLYDIVTKRTLFGVLFLIAAVIFIVLFLIKGNAVFGTHLKLKNNTLYLKSWVNNFLPYEIDGGFFSDLIPSKTKVTKVPVEDITMILIGTKDYVKRNMTPAGKKLVKTLYPYEHSSKKSKRNMISALDLFYIETKDDCAFMCIENYNPEAVVDIISEIHEINPEASAKVNNREYKKYILKAQEA